MSASLDSDTKDLTQVSVERMAIHELASIVTTTFTDSGLDRMASRRLEEFMTPVALTAHL